jgi:hypothetical protein
MVMLGDPDAAAVDSDASISDLSHAKDDRIVRAEVVSSTRHELRVRLRPQGPVGRRVVAVSCRYREGGKTGYETTKPILVVVDSALAHRGRDLADLEARRERGEVVEETEWDVARRRLSSAADRTIEKAGGPPQGASQILGEIEAELGTITTAELEGIDEATTVIRDGLVDGGEASSMIMSFIEAGLLFASLFVPGGEAASMAALLAKDAIALARPTLKIVQLWEKLEAPAVLSAAQQASAAKVGALTGASGAAVVAALREVIVSGLFEAARQVRARAPSMLADFVSVLPPHGDVDIYQSNVKLAVRNALYGAALGQNRHIDPNRVRIGAAEQVHRMFLASTARITADGELAAIRGSSKHKGGVEAASGALKASGRGDPLGAFAPMELVQGQIHRAAADLGVRVQMDAGWLQEHLDHWVQSGGFLGSSPHSSLGGSASAPMALSESIPGTWQHLWDSSIVRTDPLFDGVYYLANRNVAGPFTWWVDPKEDLVAHDVNGRWIYSLKRVRFRMTGHDNSEGFVKVHPPTSFSIIYSLE